ncbi:hypothetical protein [Nesterenkonia sphaerica]|uniref:hypothetical protein n=1 Tax=Nesterenkonia sphaerica TaxID=1804988 RepID=UPI00140DF5F9|nr:hypothetical protein [Nesterenkonia sphaerica]
MTITENPERDERAARQEEIADQLKLSAALNEIFAKMDAGQPPTGDDGSRRAAHRSS